MFTAHHDPSRCFAETLDGSFPVIVTGGWFPRAILGKAHALCAYVRCLLIAFHIGWLSWRCALLGACICCRFRQLQLTLRNCLPLSVLFA